MTRADYTDLAGAVSLNGQNGTGSGGNPQLKPVRSTNFDASLEWYFAPQSLLEVGVFYMDLTSYIGYGQTTVTAPNLQQGIATPTFDYAVARAGQRQGHQQGRGARVAAAGVGRLRRRPELHVHAGTRLQRRAAGRARRRTRTTCRAGSRTTRSARA